MFGKTSALLPANTGKGNILPASIRKFTVIWTGGEGNVESNKEGLPSEAPQSGAKEGFFGMAGKEWNNFTFGRYTADLNLKYGQDNKEVSASYSFLVIPWQLLSVIAVILAMLGFGGVIGLKKYNRWIIAKATGQKK